jgi:hypothetical protein
MRTIGIIVTALFVCVVLLGLGWAVEGNNFFIYQYFAPREEAVRRDVFEQSKAYRQGMVQELDNMHVAYIGADAEHKSALASIILHRAADADESTMPSDLRSFIHELKRERELK